VSVDDTAIRMRIKEDYTQYAREWCPHTATAAEAYSQLSEEERTAQPWVIVATAHPAKFNEIVEPIIGKPVDVPPDLQRLLDMPAQHADIPPTLEALARRL
jgi:threonine synthase